MLRHWGTPDEELGARGLRTWSSGLCRFFFFLGGGGLESFRGYEKLNLPMFSLQIAGGRSDFQVGPGTSSSDRRARRVPKAKPLNPKLKPLESKPRSLTA